MSNEHADEHGQHEGMVAVHQSAKPVPPPAPTGGLTIVINIPGFAEALVLLTQAVDALGRKEDEAMALIDDLSQDVADEATVVASAVQLLNNLSSMLAAAGTDPAKLAALKTAIDANKQALADAVVANTPAAP
jgi:hypothetical protein